jgi:hypothetical protein
LNEGSKAKEEKEREGKRQLYIQVGTILTLVVTGRQCAVVWDVTGDGPGPSQKLS